MEKEVSGIEGLWRKALQDYSQYGLEDRLKQKWQNDQNVERISFQYPPTFQPGYLGGDYWQQTKRLLILSQNPGEGSSYEAQHWDAHYSDVLKRFADGLLSWEELNREVAGEILKWGTFAEKGIFAESGDSRISLLDPSVRPSIHGIAYMNTFPFKTVANQAPASSPFLIHVWKTFVRQTIQALAPTFIIRFPGSDRFERELSQIPGIEAVVRVWHPSDYNLNTRRNQLAESWKRLNALLNTGKRGCAAVPARNSVERVTTLSQAHSLCKPARKPQRSPRLPAPLSSSKDFGNPRTIVPVLDELVDRFEISEEDFRRLHHLKSKHTIEDFRKYCMECIERFQPGGTNEQTARRLAYYLTCLQAGVPWYKAIAAALSHYPKRSTFPY